MPTSWIHSNRWTRLFGRSQQTSTRLILSREPRDKLRALTPEPAPSARVEECRRCATMVETPAGCLFEEIQYEDIQVEAVNLLTNNSLREGTDVSSGGNIPAARV